MVVVNGCPYSFLPLVFLSASPFLSVFLPALTPPCSTFTSLPFPSAALLLRSSFISFIPAVFLPFSSCHSFPSLSLPYFLLHFLAVYLSFQLPYLTSLFIHSSSRLLHLLSREGGVNIWHAASIAAASVAYGFWFGYFC